MIDVDVLVLGAGPAGEAGAMNVSKQGKSVVVVDQASEIVHIGQAIMKQPGAANSLAFFANTTFNYPTMAEAYRVAAINGLNRVS